MAACGAHAIHLGAAGGCGHSIAWLARLRAGRPVATSAPFAMAQSPARAAAPQCLDLRLERADPWAPALKRVRAIPAHAHPADPTDEGEDQSNGRPLEPV